MSAGLHQADNRVLFVSWVGKFAVVPINDNNPTDTVPYVTYLLIGLNVLVFLFELIIGDNNLGSFFRQWALVPTNFTASLLGNAIPIPQAVPPWMTLFTSQFLHGGWAHIIGNMLFLWVFGNNIEDKLGPSKYVVFYLSCGALAALCHWFFNTGSDIPSLGASGAIAGVMGAYILRFPRAEILTLLPLGFLLWSVRIPAVFFLGFWFAQQALLSIATTGMEGAGVAYWAHSGGFVFGAVLGPLLGLFRDRRPPRGPYRRSPRPRRRY